VRLVRRGLTLAQIALDPVGAHDRLLREHEPVVTFGVGRFKFTYLLGPEANCFAFANPDLFSWSGAYQNLTVVSGESALLLSHGPDHRRRRAVVAPYFTPGRVNAYREVIAENAHRVIDAWQPGKRLDLYAEFRVAIRRSTIEALFGPRLAAQESAIARNLQPSLDLADPDPWRFALRRILRRAAWRRAVAGRGLVEDLVHDEINKRARHPDSDDLLTALIAAEQASCLSRTAVVDQTISLMAAGFETTSGAFGWVCQRLLTENCAESDSEHIVAETLRLHPPAVVIARLASRTFQYAGTEIPGGRLVLLSPYATHRSPDVWLDPLRFEPARWDPASPGYRKPHRDEYLPYGAGLHSCIGARLANLELVTMLDILRTRTRFRLVGPPIPRGVNMAALRPEGGVAVLIQQVLPRADNDQWI
jgi:cytochrome P450